jgi:dTDP-4-amino-4,6-dideoxygalactose transaminase
MFCQGKPIFISLSPNVEKDDIWLALKLIFSAIGGSALGRGSWKWKKGAAVGLLEEKFSSYLGVRYAFASNSGRSAFLAILNALGLEKGNEVLLQALNCNAAVNPIIWSGLKPIFVDIEKETLNINPADLKKKITPKSKIILVQHTFGLPARMDEILEICQKHNLILIEDCAHSLGATCESRKIGSLGKAAFFSLGRDKIISSVYGGIAATNDRALAEKLKDFQNKCPIPSCYWIMQQLWHPVLTKIIAMPLYGFFGLGKYVLVGLQRMKIISKAVHKKEKQGKQPKYLPQKMPNALALLGLNQFKKLEKFNQHRQKIAEIYDRGLLSLRVGPAASLSAPGELRARGEEVRASIERIYMRYSILVEGYETNDILKFFRKRKIFLDDGWRKSVIVPPGTNQEKMGYIKGSCPMAEEVVDKIVNLPTHINISLKTAEEIGNLFKAFRRKS